MQLVGDPLTEWYLMAGDTEEIKKINALVTVDQIVHTNAPADECLTEAEWLAGVSTEDEISGILIGLFARTSEGLSLGESREASCRRTAGRIMWVKAGEWPPGVHPKKEIRTPNNSQASYNYLSNR